ncbi:amino acid export carrier protein [Corynebacterium yudongzhengii]|uniref:Threonine/serine exporter family protein n=1 Tax=Corynebacterium yudongzhengii TaxID=2080740 RepID=A0A2U1T5Q2_9CORY|nr:amino acid export carrier protein [Corynebacterium yudongzhengii]PWC01341.1 threonine/serine exporter family protein [Corynebacterium yudongzhengii]
MGFLSRLSNRLPGSGHLSTVDTARAAPPPSPLAPIDLQDPSQVAGVMSIAARIGDILLSSGTGNRDANAQLRAVTAAYGLVYCHVSITFDTIMLSTTIGEDNKQPVQVFRVARSFGTDFSKLAEVDRLIRSIQSGATPPAVAEKVLDELEARPRDYGFKTSIWGWALMGGAIAMLLGGSWFVGLVTFITSYLIIGVNEILARRGLPAFFLQITGGFVATVPTAIIYDVAQQLGYQIRPSQIIASCIIVLVAGLSLVQSLQDGITGSVVTGSARFFDTILMTAGIVAGVALGMQAASWVGISLPPMEAISPPNFANALFLTFIAAFVCIGFAVGVYAERSAIWVSGAAGMLGAGAYHLVFIPLGFGSVSATVSSATVVGLAGGLLARRFLVPPLITAIAGITPMLPGLMLYRALYALLNEQALIGFTNLFLALATAGSLATGVVLGEWLARKLRRPQTFRPYQAYRRARRFSFQALSAAQKVARSRPRRSHGVRGERSQ